MTQTEWDGMTLEQRRAACLAGDQPDLADIAYLEYGQMTERQRFHVDETPVP